MAKRQTTALIPKRGELYLVNFDPSIGSEIKKTRPALILQNDIANRYGPVTIVAGIISKIDNSIYPSEVLIEAPEGGVGNDSVILLNQIRTIDKQRLVRRLGLVKQETMERVDQALRISLGLVEI